MGTTHATTLLCPSCGPVDVHTRHIVIETDLTIDLDDSSRSRIDYVAEGLCRSGRAGHAPCARTATAAIADIDALEALLERGAHCAETIGYEVATETTRPGMPAWVRAICDGTPRGRLGHDQGRDRP